MKTQILVPKLSARFRYSSAQHTEQSSLPLQFKVSLFKSTYFPGAFGKI